ncbi:hypothetical protein ACQP1V_05555 [Microtetraspora malaysiensis]|uniref:hypothetical protein n=1 Tax=Microtetraspora malaysiensis TaxID=161358 RepID=UPI003D8B4DAC
MLAKTDLADCTIEEPGTCTLHADLTPEPASCTLSASMRRQVPHSTLSTAVDAV